MKLLLILVGVFSSITAWGMKCSPALSNSDVNELVTQTVHDYFPELAATPIKVTFFNSDAYFLQAQPSKKSLLKRKAKRIYEVQINQKLLDCPPPELALRAILVHEMEHILDYTYWSNRKIIGHAIKYSMNKKFRTQYERETDLKTLLKGQAQGLILYRQWVYQWLTPKQLRTKQRYYFTPQEIAEWLAHDDH